jgi:carbonic anhydrase
VHRAVLQQLVEYDLPVLRISEHVILVHHDKGAAKLLVQGQRQGNVDVRPLSAREARELRCLGDHVIISHVYSKLEHL